MPLWTVIRSYYNPKHDQGFWSPSTSSANFCEEEYIISYYIAEFINTLSNLAYVYFAVWTPYVQLDVGGSAIKGVKRVGSRYVADRGAGYGRRKMVWDVHSIALIGIGLSSAAFHMSLRALPQWLDESSMYVLAAGFIHALLTTRYIEKGSVSGPASDRDKIDTHSNGKAQSSVIITQRHQLSTAIGIIATLTATSYLSYQTGDLAIHSITFAIAIVLSGIKLIYLIFTFQNPHLTARPEPQASFLGFQVTMTQKSLLQKLVKAWALVNLGLALWLLDCNPAVCGWLRWVRDGLVEGTGGVGRVLGFVTEFHGWWHFFTAWAAGEYIGLVRMLTRADGR